MVGHGRVIVVKMSVQCSWKVKNEKLPRLPFSKVVLYSCTGRTGTYWKTLFWLHKFNLIRKYCNFQRGRGHAARRLGFIATNYLPCWTGRRGISLSLSFSVQHGMNLHIKPSRASQGGAGGRGPGLDRHCFRSFHCLYSSVCAQLAGQLGKMMEHLNQSQPNPSPRPPAPPCIWPVFI